METDRYGLATSGSGGIAARFDEAVAQLLRVHPDVGGSVGSLAAEFPDAAMATALSAYLPLLSTDPRDLPASRTALARAGGGNERERAHLAAAAAWAAGNMAGAGALLDEVLLDHPRDILALYVGHQIDFFTGIARNLRDRAARVLHAYSAGDDAYGFALGMAAFGVEECGDYQLALRLGHAALDHHAEDVWAIHAVVHCHEMRGDPVGGSAFLHRTDAQWSAGNGFTVHNNWHAALFDLELGRHDEVLARYDRSIRREVPEVVVPIDLVDGTSLLWRLHLAGIEVGERWTFVAEAWAAVGDEPFYAFNDMHAVMAFLGAGRLDDARFLVDHRRLWLEAAPDPSISNAMMTAVAGVPVGRGLVAFAEEDYETAWRTLLAVRPNLAKFGGSHAQRDAVDLTIIEAARRDGRNQLVAALASERRVSRGAI